MAATAAAVTAGRADDLRRHAGAAELVPDRVRVQPRRARRARQQRHRGVPAPAGRLLRAVRRHVRGDGPVARHPGARRRRLHPGPRLRATAPARCSAATPTPGRRSGSTASAGCRSSRRPGAARPAPRRTPGCRPAQDEAAPGTGAADEADGAAGDGRRRSPVEPQAIDDLESALDADTRRTARQHHGPQRRPAVGGGRPRRAASLGALRAARASSAAGAATIRPPTSPSRSATCGDGRSARSRPPGCASTPRSPRSSRPGWPRRGCRSPPAR